MHLLRYLSLFWTLFIAFQCQNILDVKFRQLNTKHKTEPSEPQATNPSEIKQPKKREISVSTTRVAESEIKSAEYEAKLSKSKTELSESESKPSEFNTKPSGYETKLADHETKAWESKTEVPESLTKYQHDKLKRLHSYKKAAFGGQVTQHVGRNNRTVKKSGGALIGFIDNIDRMESDIKRMIANNEIEKQLRRSSLNSPNNTDDIDISHDSKLFRESNKPVASRAEVGISLKKALDIVANTDKILDRHLRDLRKEALNVGNKQEIPQYPAKYRARTEDKENVMKIKSPNIKLANHETGIKGTHRIVPRSLPKILRKTFKKRNNRRSGTNGTQIKMDKKSQFRSYTERVTQMDQKPNDMNAPIGRQGPETDVNKPLATLSPFSIKKQISEICIKDCAFPDTTINVTVLGRTVEYNDIVMLQVTDNNEKKFRMRSRYDDKYVDEKPENKIVFIVHGLSPMGIRKIPCLTQIQKFKTLLKFYFKHLDKFDIFLIPMANPDGIAYQLSRNIWNKNVSPQSACPGVCLDRNFDVAWNASRQVTSCSQQYPGPMPFSEHETKAIRDVFHRHSHKIIAYMHVHAGTYSETNSFKGDAVLYPRGFTDIQSDDDKYIDLRGDIDEVMKNATFKIYNVGVDTLSGWYGKVSGSSVDFAATVLGIPYALELVMQPLVENAAIENPDDREQNQALMEVWQRIIDVIFQNIYNVHRGIHRDEKKK